MIEAFRQPFMQQALLASMLIATTCSFLGVYVVLKRIVFVGAALSEISAAGVGLALILGWSPTWASIVAALAGVALLALPSASKRIPREAGIGVTYVAASALAILLVTKSPLGKEEIERILFSGDVLTVQPSEIWMLAGMLVLVALLFTLFAKQILFTSFDPEMADASGYRSRAWELLFYVAIGLVISIAIHTVGALLAFSLLVVPAVAALMVAQGMRSAMGIAVAIGLISSALGLYFSYQADLPTGPTIVVIASGILLLASGARSALRVG